MALPRSSSERSRHSTVGSPTATHDTTTTPLSDPSAFKIGRHPQRLWLAGMRVDTQVVALAPVWARYSRWGEAPEPLRAQGRRRLGLRPGEPGEERTVGVERCQQMLRG